MNKIFDKIRSLAYQKAIRLLILFISFFILFTGLGYTIVKTYEDSQQKNLQLLSLQQDVQNQQKINDDLKKQEEYYKSDTYIEKEARDTLGLSYPNEQLYIIRSPIASAPIKNATNSASTKNFPIDGNFLQNWLSLIFGE